MARTRNSLSSYLLHKQSGKARAVWTDTVGIRHFKMLPGSFDSPESKTAFARLQLELAAAPVASAIDPVSISVCEILLAYLEYASKYYIDPDGSPSKEVGCMKSAIKPIGCNRFPNRISSLVLRELRFLAASMSSPQSR